MQIEQDNNYKNIIQGSSRVKVAVRIRPLTQKQISNNQKICVVDYGKQKLQIGKQRQFTFDRVFSETTQQQQVFQQCVKDLISKCFQGYNAAILAYGQTGSGKTYTMGTGYSTIHSGILPKVIEQLFAEINRRNDRADFVVKVSFLEIYNQQIIDLLSSEYNKNKKITSSATIREEKDGSVSVYGITEEKVSTAEQLTQILEKGSFQRSTSSTLMNETSSRSHAIFTIFIQQHLIEDLKKGKVEEQGFMTAKFHFVDLAGSERAKKTGATGSTLREGININMGLLCLGNVISALTNTQRGSKFIPYRDSKLTRILQDSLGGNSNTYMIACVSPVQSNYQETLNTLKYATRAMNIKNKPVINRDPQSALISQLKQKIYELQIQNRKFRNLYHKHGDSVNFQQIAQIKLQETNNIYDASLLKKINHSLQKKIEQLTADLQKQKKKSNEFEIENFQCRRDKEILKIKLDEMLKLNPGVVMPDITELTNVLDLHLATIQQLKLQLGDKQKLYGQMQIQYQKNLKLIKNEQQMLMIKNRQIYKLKKEIIEMVKQKYSSSKSSLVNNNEISGEKGSMRKSIQEQMIQQQDNLQLDQQYLNQSIKFANANKHTQKNIEDIATFIGQKQKLLKQITNNQIDLQYKLISQLKQQYHFKISNLEKQKEKLEKQLASFVKKDSSLEKQKTVSGLRNKKDSLQQQLRQYKKKQKQQLGLQKLVQSQKQVIRQLTSEIKTFKTQKFQLTKKLKEDKDNFEKFKLARCRQLLEMKKKNMEKQNQIQKLSKQNQKNIQNMLKKDQEFKRLKRANQTLKQILQPKSKPYHTRSREHQSSLNNIVPFVNLQNVINKVFTQILYHLDKEGQIVKYQKIISNLNIEIAKYLDRISKLKIQQERLKVRQQDNTQKQFQLQSTIKQTNQIFQELEQKLSFNKSILKQLIQSDHKKLDIDAQIIYNKNYDSIDYMRKFLKLVFQKVVIFLKQEINMRNKILTLKSQIQQLKTILDEVQQQANVQRNQHQDALYRLRQQVMMRSYLNSDQVIIVPQNNQIKKPTNQQIVGSIKIDRKFYQRKIADLNKKLRQVGMQCQQLRRKNQIISQKYQNVKKLGNKDRFIGISGRDEFDQLKIPTFRQRRLQRGSSPFQAQNAIILEQVTNSLQNISYSTLNKQQRNTFSEKNQQIIQQNEQQEYQTNKWQYISSFQGHLNPILSVTNYNNQLYSTSTKNVKIWDIETHKALYDLSGKDLNGFVKFSLIEPQKKLLITACNQNITLWDLMTMQPVSTLKGHKDEVRVMHLNNNILYSGGKGLPTSGSIFSWDFRSTTFLQEKQRNQDVFSMTSHNNILYYGSRNHQVRRIHLQNMDTLSPFQNPHFDTVTCMTHLKHYLLSGSKDKNLKLWHLDSPINNYRFTSYGHNDINTIQSDNTYPIFYSGSRDGQVRVGTVFKDKIEFISKIDCHSQSVNSITVLDDGNGFATGSMDKTIKLWKPSKDTIINLQNDPIYYE